MIALTSQCKLMEFLDFLNIHSMLVQAAHGINEHRPVFKNTIIIILK